MIEAPKRMPHIHLLSRYARNGASTRLRTMQYLPFLEEAGFTISQSSFFDSDYLDNIYSGRRAGTRLAGYFLQRIHAMRDARHADLIWLEAEALPWLPWLVEKRLLPKGVPIAVDYDDAIFHRYDRHRSRLVRTLLGRKIDAVMARADLVIAGNAYLRDRAVKAGARRVEIVPTVVDLDRYDPILPHHDGAPRVGWIGSPSTAPYLGAIAPAIEQVAGMIAADWMAIGAREDQLAPPFRSLPWTEDEEAALLRTLDIGIMPLPDDDWSRGKCGYKLIQYMACGLPVIASPVGANCEIVTHGVNGFLANSREEWMAALTRLLGDQDLRRNMGAAGRRIVEQRYSLQSQMARMAALLGSAC